MRRALLGLVMLSVSAAKADGPDVALATPAAGSTVATPFVASGLCWTVATQPITNVTIHVEHWSESQYVWFPYTSRAATLTMLGQPDDYFYLWTATVPHDLAADKVFRVRASMTRMVWDGSHWTAVTVYTDWNVCYSGGLSP